VAFQAVLDEQRTNFLLEELLRDWGIGARTRSNRQSSDDDAECQADRSLIPH
jgi:hypothetical protein